MGVDESYKDFKRSLESKKSMQFTDDAIQRALAANHRDVIAASGVPSPLLGQMSDWRARTRVSKLIGQKFELGQEFSAGETERHLRIIIENIETVLQSSNSLTSHKRSRLSLVASMIRSVLSDPHDYEEIDPDFEVIDEDEDQDDSYSW